MGDCIAPIVILLIAAAQIIAQVRKSQEANRRRAMGDPPVHRAPPPRDLEMSPPPRRIELEEIEDLLPDMEPEARTQPAWVPPRAPAEPPKRKAARPTLAIGEVVKRRRVIRLNHTRLRQAVVLSEILSPPVGLR